MVRLGELTVVAFSASSNAFRVDTEFVECVSASEVDSRQTELITTFGALFLLEVDSCCLHLDSLLLVVDNLVPYILHFLPLYFDDVTLGLQLEFHEFLEHAELQVFLFCEDFKHEEGT